MRLKKNIAVSDTGFVFNPTTGDSFSINQVGQEIIRLLKEEKSVEEVKSNITSVYEIDASSFEKYYFDFLSMLRQFELLDEEDEH
ncbi:MAG: PqqD family protein [Bacteroidales bacterium]|nr:PqqD family protein [Bacteroidales bacterium]